MVSTRQPSDDTGSDATASDDTAIDGRTRHYGTFYGLDPADRTDGGGADDLDDERPLLIVWGNCQAEAVRQLLAASPTLELDVGTTIAGYTSMNDAVDCAGAIGAMTTGQPFACMMTDFDGEVTWPVYAQILTDGTVMTGSLPAS